MYCASCFLPESPSSASSFNLGHIIVINCMIIDALINGKIPRANTENLLNPPPEKRLKKPNTPP